jgi:hypothetical protein
VRPALAAARPLGFRGAACPARDSAAALCSATAPPLSMRALSRPSPASQEAANPNRQRDIQPRTEAGAHYQNSGKAIQSPGHYCAWAPASSANSAAAQLPKSDPPALSAPVFARASGLTCVSCTSTAGARCGGSCIVGCGVLGTSVIQVSFACTASESARRISCNAESARRRKGDNAGTTV